MNAAKLLAGSAAALLLVLSASAQQSETPVPEKKLCKGVRTVGTLMEKRICLTPSEWRKFNETTRRDADVLRNRGALGRVPTRDGG